MSKGHKAILGHRVSKENPDRQARKARKARQAHKAILGHRVSKENPDRPARKDRRASKGNKAQLGRREIPDRQVHKVRKANRANPARMERHSFRLFHLAATLVGRTTAVCLIRKRRIYAVRKAHRVYKENKVLLDRKARQAHKAILDHRANKANSVQQDRKGHRESKESRAKTALLLFQAFHQTETLVGQTMEDCLIQQQ